MFCKPLCESFNVSLQGFKLPPYYTPETFQGRLSAFKSGEEYLDRPKRPTIICWLKYSGQKEL